jgi:hypothetical protein
MEAITGFGTATTLYVTCTVTGVRRFGEAIVMVPL